MTTSPDAARDCAETAVFLTAEWRDLLMLNYTVDPAILRDLVPAGTELDTWQETTCVSVVGFRFLRTRVLRVPVPLHGDFEEVNLRFYVRRKAHDGWRRGVVFVKEIVPHRAIAFAARALYDEPYVRLPMRQRLALGADGGSVEYGWRRDGAWEHVRGVARGEAAQPLPGSEPAFITEHYWGYTRRSSGTTSEYQVMHPRWTVRDVATAVLDADVRTLYGAAFAEPLAAPPRSAFLADGSAITVCAGRRLRTG